MVKYFISILIFAFSVFMPISSVEAKWVAPPFSTRDTGPYTESAGYVGFRLEMDTYASSSWRVYASRPYSPLWLIKKPKLEFIANMLLPPLTYDDVTPNLISDYEREWGPIDGPGDDGAWPYPMDVLFMVREVKPDGLGKPFYFTGHMATEL